MKKLCYVMATMLGFSPSRSKRYDRKTKKVILKILKKLQKIRINFAQ